MDYREYIERNCDFLIDQINLYRELSAENITLLDSLVGRRVKSLKVGEGYIESIQHYEDATVLVRFDDLGQTKFYNIYDMDSQDLELVQ